MTEINPLLAIFDTKNKIVDDSYRLVGPVRPVCEVFIDGQCTVMSMADVLDRNIKGVKENRDRNCWQVFIHTSREQQERDFWRNTRGGARPGRRR